MRRPILNIDIDGTLTKKIYFLRKFYDKLSPEVKKIYRKAVLLDYPSDFLTIPPWKKMVKKVNEQYECGHVEVVISTGRRVELREITKQWLKRVGVKYHRFGRVKGIYDYQWDDRSWRPEEL